MAESSSTDSVMMLWRDDAQIVREVLEKNWGEWARLEVTVEALDG